MNSEKINTTIRAVRRTEERIAKRRPDFASSLRGLPYKRRLRCQAYSMNAFCCWRQSNCMWHLNHRHYSYLHPKPFSATLSPMPTICSVTPKNKVQNKLMANRMKLSHNLIILKKMIIWYELVFTSIDFIRPKAMNKFF